MSNRRKMIGFALKRMSRFTLEKSDGGDNRSIFSLIKALIDSAHGDTLAECRKPLSAALRDSGMAGKFHGCKVVLLRQTMERLFVSKKDMLSEKEFVGFKRGELLEYIEICRRIFAAKYTSSVVKETAQLNSPQPVQHETAMQRAFRLANERNMMQSSIGKK